MIARRRSSAVPSCALADEHRFVAPQVVPLLRPIGNAVILFADWERPHVVPVTMVVVSPEEKPRRMHKKPTFSEILTCRCCEKPVRRTANSQKDCQWCMDRVPQKLRQAKGRCAWNIQIAIGQAARAATRARAEHGLRRVVGV